MTRKTLTRFLLAALLIFPLAAPAGAESTPEAQEWLGKLLSLYDRGPFKATYTADLDLTNMGQAISGNLKGTLTQGDRTHSRAELEMEMNNLPGSTEPITMRMINVMDGTTVWTQMENPALGGLQVMKVGLDQVEELGRSTGGMTPTSMDPVAQLESLTKTMDFEVVEKSKGQITLRGKITDATRAKMGTLTGTATEAFIFVLDERTGFPKEIRAEGENPFLSLVFENVELVDKAALPAGVFEYTPAEGVSVMDLGAMMQSQTGQ